MLPVVLFIVNALCVAAGLYASDWGVPAVIAWGVSMFIAGLFDGAIAVTLLFRRDPPKLLLPGSIPFAE